jgi:hypothetical protein
MNPIIQRELRAVKRSLKNPEECDWYDVCVGESRDPLRVFLAELPLRRYHEEQDREYELELKHGGKKRCDSCGKFAVEVKAVCTLGYPGHPGAEFTSYHRCTNCGKESM